MLGYAFVSLSREDKRVRRELLDFYANVAQWSVGVVLIWLQFVFLARHAARRLSSVEPPKSPHPRSWRVGFAQRLRLEKLKRGWARLCWWADEPLWRGWYTRAECLLGLLWTAWLLFLSVCGTGNDYIHLTKRFGIVASSQLPLHYLLAMRSAYSPIQLFTHLPYSRIIVLHQLLGKILTFLFLLHGIFYFNYFIQAGVLQKRIFELDVVTGSVSLIMIIVMSTTALGFLRRRNYRIFYTTHVLLALVVIDTLFFHVSHIRPYLWQSLAIFVLTQAFRQFQTHTLSGTIDTVPDTNLVRIRIPLPDDKTASQFLPGQHVHLSRPILDSKTGFALARSFLTRYRTNPFTIASIPTLDRELVLVSRTLNGGTRDLAAVAHALNTADADPNLDATPTPTIPLTLSGPYSPLTHLTSLPDYSQVLVVAGGVGATFAVPVWRALGAGMRGPLKDRITFVWAVRGVADVRWAFPEGCGVLGGGGVEVYVTGGRGKGRGEGRGEGLGVGEEEEEGIELQDAEAEGEGLLRDDNDTDLANSAADGGADAEKSGFRRGRPDLSAIVDRCLGAATGNVAVLVCGPESMTSEMRERVKLWIRRGREVYWHAEGFAV